MSVEALSQSGAGLRCGGLPGKHNDIDGGVVSTMPERFAGDTLDAIPIDCAPRRLARDRETEPCMAH